MLRVGLTGGIASGKSAVADELGRLGATIIDADLLARAVVAPGTAGLQAVQARFGADIAPEGRLDRARLGELVFTDADARRDLEAIIHPRVRALAAEQEAAAPADAVVVHVIPLLVETGQEGDFDTVIVVDVDPQVQLERLVRRNRLSVEQAQARLQAQVDRRRRLAAADIVIDNNGTMEDLARQVGNVWRDLAAAAAIG